MNVNKRIDRLRQWGKERMGGEIATTTSDEFKMLELEMDLRAQGMETLHSSTSTYLKSLSARSAPDKQTPLAHLATAMSTHGEDFEEDSELGQCLLRLGHAHARIARVQETYVANATSSWLESTERSLVQMKECSAARKRLEGRRLAYDTASAKVQRSKREDFRVEEELRAQRAKYEEVSEEVWRRMGEVKEGEGDSVADLTSFLEAELAYHERCREILLQLKEEWPASSANGAGRGGGGSGSSSEVDGASTVDTYLPHRPRASSSALSQSTITSTTRDRPMPHRIVSSPTPGRLVRVPTEPLPLPNHRDVESTELSRTTSGPSRTASGSDISCGEAGGGGAVAGGRRKAPPPPPPSRATKPKPPPVPVKRGVVSGVS